MTKVIESHPELDELLKEFKTETVAHKCLEVFSQIPENLWAENGHMYDGDKACALGHYTLLIDRHWDCIDENRLYKSVRLYCESRNIETYGFSLLTVNDMVTPLYPQPTPKQRVIALLKDMCAAGY